jgi:hypothetical protein
VIVSARAPRPLGRDGAARLRRSRDGGRFSWPPARFNTSRYEKCDDPQRLVREKSSKGRLNLPVRAPELSETGMPKSSEPACKQT